ncbi:hypothetical protein GCM10023156_02380 [Novipirellula rosea]|uniref:Uncharacterized protein n=1 Tax=Novipirellula rosea TaxID=1031540 RepID=A0ABP8M6I3_9BACT
MQPQANRVPARRKHVRGNFEGNDAAWWGKPAIQSRLRFPGTHRPDYRRQIIRHTEYAGLNIDIRVSIQCRRFYDGIKPSPVARTQLTEAGEATELWMSICFLFKC